MHLLGYRLKLEKVSSGKPRALELCGDDGLEAPGRRVTRRHGYFVTSIPHSAMAADDSQAAIIDHRARYGPESFGDAFWRLYYRTYFSRVLKTHNSSIDAGQATLLKATFGIFSLSNNTVSISTGTGSQGIPGGPASYTGNDKGVVVVSDGLTSALTSGSTLQPGATSIPTSGTTTYNTANPGGVATNNVTSGTPTGFQAQDEVCFFDPTNGTEYRYLSSTFAGGTTLTLDPLEPLLFQHPAGTPIYRTGNRACTNVLGVENNAWTSPNIAVQSFDAMYPLYGPVNGFPAITVQAQIPGGAALFYWNTLAFGMQGSSSAGGHVSGTWQGSLNNTDSTQPPHNVQLAATTAFIPGSANPPPGLHAGIAWNLAYVVSEITGAFAG